MDPARKRLALRPGFLVNTWAASGRSDHDDDTGFCVVHLLVQPLRSVCPASGHT